MSISDEQPHPISTTVLPAEEFDALTTDLDTPDSAPALAAAIRRPRRFIRAPEAEPDR